MKRRSFLKFLGLAPVAIAAAPLLAKLTPVEAALPVQPKLKTFTVTDGREQFAIGDVITFSGVMNINPMTHRSTGTLKRFVVNRVVDGKPEFWPAPLVAGPYRNVTKAPKGKPRLLAGPFA